jgi:hypothetical protein
MPAEGRASGGFSSPSPSTFLFDIQESVSMSCQQVLLAYLVVALGLGRYHFLVVEGEICVFVNVERKKPGRDFLTKAKNPWQVTIILKASNVYIDIQISKY